MAEQLPLQISLPIGADKRATGQWGLWTLVLTEASLFGYLLLSYFYLLSQAGQHWPPDGAPKLLMPAINTVILLSSSGFVAASEQCARRRKKGWSVGLMAIAIMLGIAFVTGQYKEWAHKPYGMTTNLYGSLYFTITGFHMAHVVVGIIILSLLMLWTALGYFSERRHSALTIGGLYWHFVDAVWLLIFSSFYLFPYLPGS